MDISPFLGQPGPMFWTFDDACPKFQARVDPLLACFVTNAKFIPQNHLWVWPLLTSWSFSNLQNPCYRNIFTSVCHSVHRRGGVYPSMHWGRQPPLPGRQEGDVSQHALGQTPPLGRLPGQTPPPPRRPLQQMVRILLECFLVILYLYLQFSVHCLCSRRGNFGQVLSVILWAFT